MPRKTKNQIAQEIYGFDFCDLSSGEKATVTRRYNNQSGSGASSSPSASGATEVTIGRVGHNGAQTCFVENGATVQDLLDQSGYTLDKDKEGIVAQSTGNSVRLSDSVEDGESYVITPGISSAME